MNSIAAIWFFTVASVNAPFPPSRLGPMTEAECYALRDAVPTLPGFCERAVGARMCDVPGKPWMGIACPVFESEMSVTTVNGQ